MLGVLQIQPLLLSLSRLLLARAQSIAGVPASFRFRMVLLGWISLLLLLGSSRQFWKKSFGDDSRNPTLYFYSSETSINNFKTLKSEFDEHLSARGNFHFQPFSDREVFEKFVQGNSNAVAFMSSWHFKRLARQGQTFQPLLVGEIKNKTTQKPVLCAKSEIKDVQQLRGAVIASAATKEYTSNLLVEMLGADRSKIASSCHILIVPKEIDALMAVAFGMASAALGTDTGLEKFGAVNPTQKAALNPLLVGSDIYLPVIAGPKDLSPEQKRLVAALVDMANTDQGKARLKMVGIDGWVAVDPANQRELFTQ